MTAVEIVSLISLIMNIVLGVLLKGEINRNIDLINDCFMFMDEIGSLRKKLRENDLQSND